MWRKVFKCRLFNWFLGKQTEKNCLRTTTALNGCWTIDLLLHRRLRGYALSYYYKRCMERFWMPIIFSSRLLSHNCCSVCSIYALYNLTVPDDRVFWTRYFVLVNFLKFNPCLIDFLPHSTVLSFMKIMRAVSEIKYMNREELLVLKY